MMLRIFRVLLFLLAIFAGRMFADTPRTERYGVYNWNLDESVFRGHTDRLNEGADLVAQTGSRVIRVYLGTRDIYHLGLAGNEKLVDIARHPAYDRLFADPRFSTYLLTVYSASSESSTWWDGFGSVEFSREREEIRALAAHLLTYPGKRFILPNWEADHALHPFRESSVAWEGYRRWTEARAEGVRLARDQFGEWPARVHSALEYTTTEEGSVLYRIAPHVSVDYYSYSAWYSAGVKAIDPNASLADRLSLDLSTALGAVRVGRPDIQASDLLIGEIGFSREHYGDHAADYLTEALEACESISPRPSLVIVWQAGDNAYSPGAATGYGLFTAAGPTLSGLAFAQFLFPPLQIPVRPSSFRLPVRRF